MLEALEQIRAAEEGNKEAYQRLQQEMKRYAEQKTHELENIQSDNRQQLARMIEEKDQFEQQELNAEKESLEAEAKNVRETLKEQYKKHQSQAIDAIIERVKETYGRH